MKTLAETRPAPHDAPDDWPCVECGHTKGEHATGGKKLRCPVQVGTTWGIFR